MQPPSMFRDGLFDGQVALVTGGGSGIGLATATELASLGGSVAICGRNAEKIAAARVTLAEAGIPDARVLGGTCDIRDAEAVARFVGEVVDRFGKIDVLVNNAGGQFPSTAETMSPKGWEAVIRNNLNGTFFMTREVANRAMIPQRRGRIVMVTAMVSRGFPGMSHTGAARAGVENLSKSLVALQKATPLRRLGSVEEVARVILFLASDMNDFVTGQVWGIDGGQPLWGDMWPIPEREAPAT